MDKTFLEAWTEVNKQLRSAISIVAQSIQKHWKGIIMSDMDSNTLAENLVNCETEAAANILAGMLLAKPEVFEIKGIPHIVTPVGSELTKLEELMERPARLKASPVFNEPQSYCDYINQFKEAGPTRIYADAINKKFMACLDDHQPGVPS